MKSIITKIKFNECEWRALEKMLNSYEWGDEAIKLKVTWANKAARELFVKSYDSENNRLSEIVFWF